jgi:hypothetical protein
MMALPVLRVQPEPKATKEIKEILALRVLKVTREILVRPEPKATRATKVKPEPLETLVLQDLLVLTVKTE